MRLPGISPEGNENTGGSGTVEKAAGLGWVESQPHGSTGHGVKTSAGIQASETGARRLLLKDEIHREPLTKFSLQGLALAMTKLPPNPEAVANPAGTSRLQSSRDAESDRAGRRKIARHHMVYTLRV